MSVSNWEGERFVPCEEEKFFLLVPTYFLVWLTRLSSYHCHLHTPSSSPVASPFSTNKPHIRAYLALTRYL